VRKSYLSVALAASFLAASLVAPNSLAQQPTRTAVRPSTGGTAIALLDVSYVFKNHGRFKAMSEGMKADIDQAEADVKAQQAQIRKKLEELQRWDKGSVEYKQWAEEITTKRAELSFRIESQKDDFLRAEAKIYHNVYQEILQEVDYFAGANGIGLVLRFSRDQADISKPETVLRDINKPVVWSNRQLDITDAILSRLNQRAAPSRVGTQPPRPGVPLNKRR